MGARGERLISSRSRVRDGSKFFSRLPLPRDDWGPSRISLRLCMITQYQIIYWRDIPAQVKIRAGPRRLARSLSDRFQEGIDEAAMRTQAAGTEEYLSAWRMSEWRERGGVPEAVADALALELESAYPSNRLRILVEHGGFDPEIAMRSQV